MSAARGEMKPPVGLGPPETTPEFLWPAWASAIKWAIGEPKVLAEFTTATGVVVPIAHTTLDAMIDDATGRNEMFARAFVAWFNEYIWGSETTSEVQG